MLTEHDPKLDMDDILIVDDESANLKLLSEILVREGYRVRPANRPQLAIDSAISQPPKLILLDIKMPEMDGFEVCRYLKQYDQTRDVPVLFVSALHETRDKIKGFEVGGVDFISKPFDELEVLARVRTHLNLRNLQLNMEGLVRKRTEQVFESEARFRATFDQAAVGIAHVSPEGRFLRLNDKFCDIVGYGRLEMQKLTLQDITHPDDLKVVEGYLDRLLKDEIQTFSVEKRYLHKTGDLVWCNKTVSLVRDEAGQPKWFVVIIQDITEKKNAEEQLNIFKETIDVSADSAFWANSSGRFVYVNEAACAGLGYSRDELLQMEMFDVVPHLSKEKWPQFWAERRKQGVLHFETAHRRKDGSTFPVELTSVYIENNGKELVNGFARDITERKRAEHALRKNEQLARTLLNATTDLTQLLDEDGTILDMNDAMAERLGGKREELIGTCVFDTFPPGAASERKNKVKQAIAEKKNLRFVDGMSPDKVFDTGIYPVTTPEGEKNQVVIFAHDITENEKIMQELQQNRDYLEHLISSIPDAVFSVKLPERIVEWASDPYNVLNMDLKEFIGKDSKCLYSREEEYEAYGNKVSQAIRDKNDSFTTEATGQHQNGEFFPVEISTTIYREKGEPVSLTALVRDISERKKALEALENSEARLKEAQRIAGVGNWDLELTTNTLYWSDEIFRIFEIDPEHFEANYEAFLNAIHPDDRDMVDKAYSQSLKKRQPYKIDHRLLMPDGRIKYVHEQCETEYSPEGKPLRSVGTIQDITELKIAQNESMNLRLELAHLNRVMTMNELAASLAHEINQPLGAIMNNASAARNLNMKSDGGQEELDEILEDIASDALRAGQIIRKVRGVMKPSDSVYNVLDINKMLDEVVNLYRNACRLEHISLVVHKEQERNLSVKGDQIRLQQVLMNLITNAMDSMASRQKKVMHVRSRYESPDSVVLSVSDTGPGVDEKIKEKIFTSFYTTKQEGMGIGLRLCQFIVEEHGGRIWVENNQDGGATFSFSLQTITE